MAKILIVDDDIELAQNISEWLALEHHNVKVVHSAATAKPELQSGLYDVIILDWTLPDGNGPEICRDFRASGGNTPILFLTGQDSLENKEQGLAIGADDYVTKPVHIKELAARIRALRRTAPLHPPMIACGQLTLDMAAHVVTKAGSALALLPKEYALLEYLMLRQDQVFSPAILLSAVWHSDSQASEETIRTYIKTLRKKITVEGGDCPLKTVHGFGYKIESAG